MHSNLDFDIKIWRIWSWGAFWIQKNRILWMRLFLKKENGFRLAFQWNMILDWKFCEVKIGLVFPKKGLWIQSNPKNSRFFSNFYFSNLHAIWESNLSLRCWLTSHGCLTRLSRDIVLQSLNYNFPWPQNSTQRDQNFWIFQIFKFGIVR